jgi:hypothetical protein
MKLSRYGLMANEQPVSRIILKVPFSLGSDTSDGSAKLYDSGK